LSACCFHQLGNFINLLRRFDGAWTAHDNQIAAANLGSLNIDHRIIRMEITAGKLVGLGDLNYILYALHLAKMLRKLRVHAANQADHRAIRPLRYVSLEPFLLDFANDMLNLFL
jgi:hypothetical protein